MRRRSHAPSQMGNCRAASSWVESRLHTVETEIGTESRGPHGFPSRRSPAAVAAVRAHGTGNRPDLGDSPEYSGSYRRGRTSDDFRLVCELVPVAVLPKRIDRLSGAAPVDADGIPITRRH